MNAILAGVSAEQIGALLQGAMLFVLYVGLWLPLVCGVLYALHFLLTLPMRRNERARVFLDLLEWGLKAGHTPESTVVGAASSRDPGLGVRFHWLAIHLESGLRLSAGLQRVPGLLPPQLSALLRVGERLGDVARVLPAGRRLVSDGVSQTRAAVNHLVVLLFCLTPVTLLMFSVVWLVVLPRWREVLAGVLEGRLPPTLGVLFEPGAAAAVLTLEGLLFLAVWTAALAHVGGPRVRVWLEGLWPGSVDRVALRLPWRRKRLLRDFSAALAALLDAGVPEAEAVSLAAETTTNSVLIGRAGRVREALAAGVALPEALRCMDTEEGLAWYLSNALRGRSGFLQALEGWHEALDAKAFQLEQGAAQTVTTALVLFNGVLIGGVCIGAFALYLQVIQEALLW